MIGRRTFLMQGTALAVASRIVKADDNVPPFAKGAVELEPILFIEDLVV
ncbi:MAG: hypothetical protein IKO55_17925 [Kiritimatiellae bacterium]|nr:hypothetical protein [Kiritimatiellia bacterium]